ncbi:MAG: sulfite exporter TauE/SafE family protein [Ignavibacteriales bacterium]|nr:sulfite exporter TauE/SafE family protein [Ignavibacteriales bacterium]
MSISSFLLLFAGGVATGTIGGLLGIGGGVFLIPFLVLVFGIPMHQAIATSIVAVIATSSAGAAMNVERHLVNVRLGMVLEIATVFGAIFGGLTANLLSGDILTKIFAMLLLIVAGMMAYKMRRAPEETEQPGTGILQADFVDAASGKTITYGVKRIPLVILVSLIAGNVSGLLGVGGGIFKVPAMNMIAGIPIKAATATSNFMIGVTAAASAFIYFSHGHLNPLVASAATLGVLAGSYLGINLGRRIHSTLLTWIFIVVLGIVALRMYLK